MDYILNDTSDVSMTLSIVERSELSWVFSQSGVRGENATGTLPLRSDDSTHGVGCMAMVWFS